MKEAITWQKQKQKQWKIENQMKLNDKFLGFLLSTFLNVFPFSGFCTVYYMLKMALKKKFWICLCYLKGNFTKKIFFYMFFLMYKCGCLYVYQRFISEHRELYSNMGMRMQHPIFHMMRLKSFRPEVDKSWQSRRECQK